MAAFISTLNTFTRTSTTLGCRCRCTPSVVLITPVKMTPFSRTLYSSVSIRHNISKTKILQPASICTTTHFTQDNARSGHAQIGGTQSLWFLRHCHSPSNKDVKGANTIDQPDNIHFKRKLDAVKKDTVPQEVSKEGENPPPIGTHALPHPIWTEEQLHGVEITHKQPKGFVEKAAYFSVQWFRLWFDILSGFKFGQRNEKKWLIRVSFLETVAGVPGMVAAMLRHLRSLRRLERDAGWIHTLLEEAENERMHLMTALQLKQPSKIFLMTVLVAQGVFTNVFFMAYLASPRFCHNFVGYLEEEAVKTYTKMLEDINSGSLQHWKTQPAPEIAVGYWKLGNEATMRDVILAIRADEAHHRVVNHDLAAMKPDQYNPYKPGE